VCVCPHPLIFRTAFRRTAFNGLLEPLAIFRSFIRPLQRITSFEGCQNHINTNTRTHTHVDTHDITKGRMRERCGSVKFRVRHTTATRGRQRKLRKFTYSIGIRCYKTSTQTHAHNTHKVREKARARESVKGGGIERERERESLLGTEFFLFIL